MVHFIWSNVKELSLSLEEKLLEVKKYMEQSFDKPIQIEQLAKMVQVSEHYFVDLFTKHFGNSPIKYLHIQRIKKAKELLIQSDLKLRDVAQQVGVSDEYYFSRWFKKKTGISPSEYRKKREKKIAVSHRNYIGQLLALDIVPYAAPLHPKWTPYYYQHYRTDIPVHLSAYKIDEKHQANLEKLVELSPEIIISDRQDKLEISERLTDRSHVYSIYYEQKTWREQLMMIAKYLDKATVARNWLTDFDKKLLKVKSILQETYSTKSFLFIRKFKQNFHLNFSRTMLELFYGELAFTSPVKLSNNQCVITLEEIAELQPDYLMLMICQEQETLDDWNNVQNSDTWNELKAVQENNVHILPTDPWFEYSAIAHDRILDQLLTLLSEHRPNYKQ
jgi:AraC family transcriptional regulator, transcriptional activator for feuABC-ybbA operon